MKNLSKLMLIIITCLSVFAMLCIAVSAFCIFQYVDNAKTITDIESQKSLSYENKYEFHNTQHWGTHAEIDKTNYIAGFLYEYVYEDIHFLADSDVWGDKELESIAEELFSNLHGDEMQYVEAVILNFGYGVRYFSDYDFSFVYYDIPLDKYKFFPNECEYNIKYEKGFLYVNNIDEETIAEDLAQALSVAYGYHFAHYYLGLNGTDEDKDTEYYKLRSQNCDDLIVEYETNEDYKEKYNWFMFTVAANDYMYLMGSENTHRIAEFYSRNSMAHSIGNFEDGYEAIRNVFRYCRNATPHANVALDMPHRVDRLADYFYSFVDAETPTYTMIDPIGDLNMTASAAKHDDFIIVEWDVPFKEKDILYTLVAYNPEGDVVAIVESDNGTAPGYGFFTEQVFVRINNRKYYTYSGYEENEDKIFRVLIAFPDGTVEVSEPLILERSEKESD